MRGRGALVVALALAAATVGCGGTRRGPTVAPASGPAAPRARLAGPVCSAPLPAGVTTPPLAALAAAALPGFDPATSTVPVDGEAGIAVCAGEPLPAPECETAAPRLKVTERGRIGLPDGRLALCLVVADCDTHRSGALVVARVEAATRRVVIDALEPWGASREPQHCDLAARILARRLVLEEREDDSGTCDNPASFTILRVIASGQFVTLARLETKGVVGDCGGQTRCPWLARHESELEYGAELLLTTTVTWWREREQGCRAAGPVTRTVRRTLRLAGDRLLDPQRGRKADNDGPSVEIGNPPD